MLLAALVLPVAISCSTKKNTLSRRIYHNVTSHYNIYWNGREAMKEALGDMKLKVKDNYDEILTVFNFGTKSDAQSLNQQWDRAIEKASFTIQKHSMVFEGEEKVKWIDDSYLLIGQAYFFKQEYISARRTFNFIIREYGSNDIRYEAMLWLARTYNMTKEYEKAEPLLNLVTKDAGEGKVSYDVMRELPQVYADHYIRQEKYSRAVDYLYEAVAYNPERDLKTRMLFILGQISQSNGDLTRASMFYEEVIKRNPPYEMAFRSNINLARSYDASAGDSKMITKLLGKMVRDDKNKDFKDQIYFALAEIALKDGDTLLAIQHLVNSVGLSTTNGLQKSTSALRLADLYFLVPQYEKAQAYYDTSMMFLPKEYPDYEELDARTKILKELVGHLVTIYREDSLQNLAAMPEATRNQIINQKIQSYIIEQQRLAEEKRLEEAIRAQEQVSALGAPTNQGFQAGGKWYFYNEQTKSYGYSEFVRKWGRRRHEDLWRLSNKQATAYVFAEPEPAESDTVAPPDSLTLAASDPMKKEFYLKDLPMTEEALAASNKMVLEAYFNLGKLYLDGLNDQGESRKAFEKMEARFPNNEHELHAFYYLYKICTAQGDAETAARYKEIIVTRYPDSDYAKILTDPQYFARIAAEKNKEAVLYEQTFRQYEAGQYYLVIANSDLAMSTYGDSTEFAPKFAYLKAVSIGKVDVLDSLVSNLKRIVTQYPGSEVRDLSMNLLTYIARENPEYSDIVPGLPEKPPEKVSPYRINVNSQHLFLLLVDSKQVRLNPLKVKISDHNIKYHSLDELTVNTLVLDDEHYMVTVGNFKSSTKALDYLAGIMASEYVFADLAPGTYTNLVISTENYATFFKEKNIEEYQIFFDKNYSKP
jgi:TolA-binding protein